MRKIIDGLFSWTTHGAVNIAAWAGCVSKRLIGALNAQSK